MERQDRTSAVFCWWDTEVHGRKRGRDTSCWAYIASASFYSIDSRPRKDDHVEHQHGRWLVADGHDGNLSGDDRDTGTVPIQQLLRNVLNSDCRADLARPAIRNLAVTYWAHIAALIVDHSTSTQTSNQSPADHRNGGEREADL